MPSIQTVIKSINIISTIGLRPRLFPYGFPSLFLNILLWKHFVFYELVLKIFYAVFFPCRCNVLFRTMSKPQFPHSSNPRDLLIHHALLKRIHFPPCHRPSLKTPSIPREQEVFECQNQHDSHHQTAFQQCMDRGGKGLKKRFRKNGDNPSHEHGNTDNHIISPIQGP